jgi:hypothetical protein
MNWVLTLPSLWLEIHFTSKLPFYLRLDLFTSRFPTNFYQTSASFFDRPREREGAGKSTAATLQPQIWEIPASNLGRVYWLFRLRPYVFRECRATAVYSNEPWQPPYRSLLTHHSALRSISNNQIFNRAELWGAKLKELSPTYSLQAIKVAPTSDVGMRNSFSPCVINVSRHNTYLLGNFNYRDIFISVLLNIKTLF